MERIWWLMLHACVASVIYAAPREYSTDELITEPRPGEEFVNIQTTSKDKVDLQDKTFMTSHRIPQLSKNNRSQDFQTSHKIPLSVARNSRSVKPNLNENVNSSSSSHGEPFIGTETRVSYSVVEGTTNGRSSEDVVTKTSIKMSKSKKVQKSVGKPGQDGIIDLKANEGVIDERPNADEEERNIMKKKFLKNERAESTSEVFLLPTRFNVPLEEDVKDIMPDAKEIEVLIPNPVLATTQEPPITTFNYKNIYEKSKNKGLITLIPDKEFKGNEKLKYETITSESIKTAESKTIGLKKDTKQDKKDKIKKDEIGQKDAGFYILPVNKQDSKNGDENFDFVDVDEKVFVPAGSSPSQSSRINIKKGPNGQDYEYEYVYYYYDDEDEGTNSPSGSKEEKEVSATTEKIYNGHDGPPKEDQDQNSVQSKSTNANKYLPTEATKPVGKGKKKTEEQESDKGETYIQISGSKGSRGSNGNRFAVNGNKQPEAVNNEILPPASRTGFRPRGRSPGATTEEIPAIGEERLPSNTRFPPRSRANNAPSTSPQPQENTRTRNRENANQSRLRIPNSSLLDSSSFRTHSSDAPIEEDTIHDSELQKITARGQAVEVNGRRGRPFTTSAQEDNSELSEITRKPSIRKPVEDRRPIIPVEEVEEPVRETRPRVFQGEASQERLPQVPSEEVENSKAPGDHEKKPRVPLEDQEITLPPTTYRDDGYIGQQQYYKTNEEGAARLETARESETEEGISEKASDQTKGGRSQNLKLTGADSTTEDQTAIGLTSAMMEKVALDLYAILQQAQNENIRTNFIDGNSTDVSTDLGEGTTEFSASGAGVQAEVSSTTPTPTTTTTTTIVPTTSTTTTNPSPLPGKGRYRGRASSGSKGRSKVTTAAPEIPDEVTSPKIRGRYQPSHGHRGSGTPYGRKPTKPQSKETNQEVSAGEEIPKTVPEKSFGERPRSRFRSSTKGTAVTSSTVAPSNANGSAGSRSASGDRYYSSRRRGGSRGSVANVQSTVDETNGEEKHDQNNPAPLDETSSAPSLRPTKPRVGGSVRPLRPGPRAPLLLPQRGNAATSGSTTQLPVEHDETKKETVEQEAQSPQPNEEFQEAATTPAGDALTRLKSRPRLRIGPNTNNHRPQTPAPPPANRRKLVSSLLPKRKPTEEKPITQQNEEADEKISEEAPVEEDQPSISEEPLSTTAEPDSKSLTGLLAGRRRNLNRRAGTLYSRPQPSES